MNDENREDDDPPIDMDAAARFRQLLKSKAQATFDPLHQAMMEMDQLAEEIGIQIDFDEDFSDISDDW